MVFGSLRLSGMMSVMVMKVGRRGHARRRCHTGRRHARRRESRRRCGRALGRRGRRDGCRSAEDVVYAVRVAAPAGSRTVGAALAASGTGTGRRVTGLVLLLLVVEQRR